VLHFVKSIIVLGTFTLLLSGGKCFSKAPHGFGVVNFEDHKEKAIQKLIKKYAYKQQGDKMIGSNNSSLNNSQKTIWITGFALGKKRKVTIWLFFNDNYKFYKYEIESEAIPVKNGKTKIKKMAEFMGKVFQTKFGPPEKKHDLSHLKLKEGYLSIYMKWKFKHNRVFIAYKLTGENTNIIASVINTRLESEKMDSSPTPKSDIHVDEAAKSF